MKPLELAGSRFGNITAINKIKKENDGENYWLCKCDCGNEFIIPAYKVKSYSRCTICKKGTFYKEIIELEDSFKIIVSTKKYGNCEIFIDKEDLERVKQFWWDIYKPKKVFYAQAWCRKDTNGNRKGGRLHQFIMGFPNAKFIDHKDGNGLNNRKSNLRIANGSQSAANRSISINEAVQWKGVSFIKHKKLYVVQLSKDNKIMNFGRFKNPLLAAAKYNEMALKYHGEFARLNIFTKEQQAEIDNPPIETRRINRNNKTGYIGVSFKNGGSGSKPYIATIYVNGSNKMLGTFKTAKQAALAYNQAALKIKGNYASLNNL